MGGGVVVLAAAQLQGRVKAIVTQAASLDGVRNVMFNLEKRGVWGVLRILLAALTDIARWAHPPRHPCPSSHLLFV